MNDLGRLEDLPAEYVSALRAQNLVPLWPSLRGVMPPGIPTRQTRATCWSYAALKPLLLRAGELTPIEKAERRVLVLANPGHGLERMQASAAIYMGIQLLMPGEWAPSHRHTPNAIRMVIEGEGAWTTVEGEKLPMGRGDLILTPTGLWHEHGHDGSEPVTWLDVLDLPLVHYLEASYHVNGGRQPVTAGEGHRQFVRGGLLPTRHVVGQHAKYPMLRYPWAQTRAALEALATQVSASEIVQSTYVNPTTGDHAESILGYYALMLRPGQAATLKARSPAAIFHVIEGAALLEIDGQSFDMVEADSCCAPGYTPVTLRNTSARAPAFLFMADETPLHQKLGVYEER
jgi:gentisate 1,2-dioxygenase